MQRALNQKMKKHKINLAKAAGFIILFLGLAALTISIVYTSQISSFIGLGLVFWGIILTYIQTEEYVKKDLLDSTTLSSLETISQIIQQMEYVGKAVHLPPKYFKEPETVKVFVSKQSELKLPAPEQIQEQENKVFIENPQGLLLLPLGAALVDLFEKTVGTSFATTNLQSLKQSLPKLFVEELEVAQNFEMETENNKVRVKIERSFYSNLTLKAAALPVLSGSLGCPLSSAIACVLAKATGKPVVIESLQVNEKERRANVEFHILEEEPAKQ